MPRFARCPRTNLRRATVRLGRGGLPGHHLVGGGVSATDCAARLASVRIEECLARFEASPNRRWMNQRGGFRLLDVAR